MPPTTRRKVPRSLAGSASVAILLASGLALAADQSPIDRASAEVSQAISLLKEVKLGAKGDEHLDKARAYLSRARAELLKAQGQDGGEP